MRIAICDDLQQDRSDLKTHLETIANYTIAEFENGSDLIDAHSSSCFDLIFLDCIMPGLSGIDTAAEIRKTDKKTPIIFVSTSEEFGVDSYRVFAYDYILKPIDRTLLLHIMKRFLSEFVKKQYITVVYQGVPTKMLISNILYIESSGHKLIFTLIDNQELIVSGKLSDYEEKLSASGFIRCHKDYLINAEHADSIDGDFFRLTGGTNIKISRACLKCAKKQFFDYLFDQSGINDE